MICKMARASRYVVAMDNPTKLSGISKYRLALGFINSIVYDTKQAMQHNLPITVKSLQSRRKLLGIAFPSLAQRSGVPVPTVKRIFGGQIAQASFANIAAIANALGLSLALGESSADQLCRQQARKKAQQMARLVQGTSALESQAVDEKTYNRLVEKAFREILAGPKRKLWSA